MLLSELILNARYTEILSGKTVIVIGLNTKGRNQSIEARIRYYNEISGRFETFDAVDNQLRPFDTYPPNLQQVTNY